jgi:hypothetical protein
MGNFLLFSALNMSAAVIAATTAPVEWAPPIGIASILSTVLGWFMFRLEKILQKFATKLHHVASSSYMVVINSRTAEAGMKNDAAAGLERLKKDEEPDVEA